MVNFVEDVVEHVYEVEGGNVTEGLLDKLEANVDDEDNDADDESGEGKDGVSDPELEPEDRIGVPADEMILGGGISSSSLSSNVIISIFGFLAFLSGAKNFKYYKFLKKHINTYMKVFLSNLFLEKFLLFHKLLS